VITPPVGINVYVVSGVARDVPLQVIFKGVLPFLLALIIGTLFLIPFPQIALFLPNLMR
jgi:C4-dicarboxylate transporter DctM subunit